MTVDPFIEAEKQSGHNVKRACELLEVSRTAFYARRTGKPGPRAVRDAELTGQIAGVHQHLRGTYGAPRIHAALQRKGAGCGRRRVARLMRAAGLQGRHRRRRHLTRSLIREPPFGPTLSFGTSPRIPRRSTPAGAATSHTFRPQRAGLTSPPSSTSPPAAWSPGRPPITCGPT